MKIAKCLLECFRVVGDKDVYWAVFQIRAVDILSVCSELLVRAFHQIRDDRLPSLVSVLKQVKVAGAGQVQVDGVLAGGLRKSRFQAPRLPSESAMARSALLRRRTTAGTLLAG